MLGHGAGIGYTGPGPGMGPTDNFSLVTGPSRTKFALSYDTIRYDTIRALKS